MIDLFYCPTPNGWKATIMLEECGLPYRTRLIDITKGEQFDPALTAVNPNNRIPAIIDHDAPGGPQSVFESGAILLYLAERTGRFLAPTGPARVAALEWLFWQVSSLGPVANETYQFRRRAPDADDYGTERYTKECRRLYGVLNDRLAAVEWLAGAEYGIADIACWGWVWFRPQHGIALEDFPSVQRWFDAVAARPAVRRGKVTGLETVDAKYRVLFEGSFYGEAWDHAAEGVRVAERPA